MSTLLDELWEISPNGDLFKCIRDGKDLPAQGNEKSPNALIAKKTREKLLELVRTNTSTGLEELISQQSNDNDRVYVYGECILALAATKTGSEEKRELLRRALRPFLQTAPTDPVLVRAKREWLILLLEQLEIDNLTPEQILNLRYQIAACTNQCRPGLVGDSFFMVGMAAKEAGDNAKALQCFESVRNDMKTNLSRELPRNLRYEVYGILYWYKRACAELIQMGGTNIQSELDQIQERFQGVTSFEPFGAMVGPIAQTYLSREAYLKKMLKEIRDATSKAQEALENVCYRYDYCHDIDTYLFAIERYQMVLPIMPAGVQMNYDPPVEEALDILKSLD